MKKLALGCALVCVLLADGRFQPAAPQPKPEGEMRWALYVTLSPVWFDPGEGVGVITPFYGTLATAAGWIVPKKYVEQVGDDGFKKHPVGLGPYRFVSHTPGIELVMEAFEDYWRKVPHVKRLVYKSVPEATTRLAMLKKGEVDLAYLLDAPQAQELRRDPTLKLAFSGGIGTFFLDFFDQWDPKSPWHDRRVRQAASYAMDRRSLREAGKPRAPQPAGEIVPPHFEVALPVEPDPYDPVKAEPLLAEAR